MLRDAYNECYKRLRRKPDALEISIEVLTWAWKVERAKEAATRHPQSWQYGADRSALGRLVSISHAEPRYYSADFANAEAARLVFETLGNKSDPRWDDAIDRTIIDTFVEQVVATGGMNASAIGRDIKTSHVTVKSRALARCGRIVGALLSEFPGILNVIVSPRKRRQPQIP
jgi:hypothetical protein